MQFSMRNQAEWNVALVSRCLLLLQIVFFLGCSKSMANVISYGDFDKQGSAKNAWPEFQGANATEAANFIRESGLVKEVHVQDPAPPEQSPPFNPGRPEDVWIYTDSDGFVLGIPRRGQWHFNRLSPGWVELVGVAYEEAIETILEEQIGVVVVYGPEGFIRTEDIRKDRVFLDVAKDGTVALTPVIL